MTSIVPSTNSSLEIMRHALGSITGIPSEEMSESDRKARVAAIGNAWPWLEKDLKKFLYEQLIFQGREAQIWDQVLFSRGTINGFDLLMDHWKMAYFEYTAPKDDDLEDNL